MVDLLGKWEVGGVIYWNFCKYAWKHTEYESNSNDLGSQYFVWPPFKARWMLPAFFSFSFSLLFYLNDPTQFQYCCFERVIFVFLLLFLCVCLFPHPGVLFAACLGLSCRLSPDGFTWWIKILWYFSLFIIPPILRTPPTPLAKMEPQTMMVAAPWFSNALNWQSFEL